MTRYLLAAEANKIQDLLFRSSRLREVAGGSHLLTAFCREIPPVLGIPENDIITSDGGSFRLLFDTQEQAEQFGKKLAEAYRRTTGGSMSIANPVPYEGDAWTTASENAEKALRKAKRWQTQGETPEHAPYIAFCASCGVGLAVKHTAYHRTDNQQFLCQSCLNKGARPERQEAKRPIQFLDAFYQTVMEGDADYDWPGRIERKGRKEKDPLEDIADYDSRRYVAFLVADGNNMGKAFGQCDKPEKARALSQGLSKVVRKALAQPTRVLMESNPRKNEPEFIPVYPLILGGDDVFVLLPAPWALDFAARFCKAYEAGMKALFKDIGLENVPPPTMAASVVICKSKHPYALAHESGESRLKAAKRMSKQWAQGKDNQAPPSSINFEVVLGGRLVTDDEEGKFRSTLRPYWADEQLGDERLSIEKLIEQRLELNALPHKRLVELRDLFDNPPSSVKPDDIAPWKTRLETLLARLQVTNPGSETVVLNALKTLGSKESPYWRRMDELNAYAHGLPDLLQAWDFTLKIDEKLSKYEEKDT